MTTVNIRRLFIVLLDLLVVMGAFILAFLLRFDFNLSPVYLGVMLQTMPHVLVIYFASAYGFSLYRGIYHFSSFSDLINITKAVALGAFVSAATILFVCQGNFPRSILILHPILVFLFVGGIRFGIRLVKSYLRMPWSSPAERRRVLLVGAGNLGESLLRQMLRAPGQRYQVVGFIDDDPSKWGMRLHGHTVFGGRQALGQVLDKHAVDEIVITIEARRGDIVRSVVEKLRDRSVKPEVKIAPSLDEMLVTPGAGLSLRSVRPADLLNRKVVELQAASIARMLEGKTVLVTGAGGTIGSELGRQVLRFGPQKVVLVDNHATSLFYAESDLLAKSGGARIVPVLGDIRDQALLEALFLEHRPQVVLHAAAHKHVHQLEFNVREGVANNVLGTYYLAAAAHKHQAEAFLLVSTDKAVRPAGVMGATKRLAELIVQHYSRRSRTRFAAVRFGNVLGSSGSVLEIFQDQIARGGPLTVTHPEVTRYFMTVEEAVQLILQAVSLAQGGEIFVLNMGTPVKIMDMAKNLLLLSGLSPDKDIEIKITGLRSGEKMSEELLEDPSGLQPSGHPDIMVLRASDEAREDFEGSILEMEVLIRSASPGSLVRKLQNLVPFFTPDPLHGGDSPAGKLAGQPV